MKRKFKKSVIPAETLVGYSSDESDSEPDEYHCAESSDSARRRLTDKKSGKVSLRVEAGHHSNDVRKPGDAPVGAFSSKPIQERPDERRFPRQTLGSPGSAPVSRSTQKNDTDFEASSSNLPPSVEAAPDGSIAAQNDGKPPDGKRACSGDRIPICAMRTPSPRNTTGEHVEMRDSGLDVGSSLCLNFGEDCKCKRATFDERVEVRTSPTYWQREHSLCDDNYAKFRHEQYHEALREGKKATPLQQPLRDPDGLSAKPPHQIPRYSPDEGSFNSWSMPDAGYDESTTPKAGYYNDQFSSTSNSKPSRAHPSSLYTAENYHRNDQPRSSSFHDTAQSNEIRSNPENRLPESCNMENAFNSQGKENRPFHTDHTTHGNAHSSHFSGNHINHEDLHCDIWSGPCPSSLFAEQSESSKYTESAWGSQMPRADHQNFGTFDHCHGDCQLEDEQPPRFSRNTSDDASRQVRHPNLSDNASQPGPGSSYTQQWPGPQSTAEDWSRERPCSPDKSSWGHSNWDNSANAPNHRSTDRKRNCKHKDSYSNTNPFEPTSTTDSIPSLHEHQLPPVGFVMEIPDDISDSDVHTMLIPGFDDYIPWRAEPSPA